MKKIDVVVPCYNEEKNIEIFYNEIKTTFEKINDYSFEIIFVLDRGKDKSYDIVRNLSRNDERIKYIFMSGKFGKEACMQAGLEKTTGDLICIMDVDLQDPPEIIPEMIKYIEKGYDSVATRRTTRKHEPIIRSVFSNLFYKIMKATSNINMESGARDFRLMTRKMLNEVLKSKEKNRFIKAIYGYTGFNTKWLEHKNIERKYGKTKWSFWKLFEYSMTCIFGFTNAPLVFLAILGTSMLIISILLLIFWIIYGVIYGNYIFRSIKITDIAMFFTSINILCITVLCQYMYNIYIEVKNKPTYIIDETNIK